ncbi:hypothetical protein Ahy_A07g036636 [Arachis hypogaea]|uniref:Transposase MuDR plant domain-containing protein n=1 Tax=Arachis hypogaea TaxID=3818 RepID=A0A445CGL7_ARAHY|nr:hypothetical protein Ahy_A07g036636 [Arachis hypogaea]
MSLRRKELFECISGVIEDTANLVVDCNSEIIRNIHEGVRFVCQNPFLFVVSCTMTFMVFQNGLCQNMENGMLRRVRQPQIKLYFEFQNVEADGIQNDLDVEDDRAVVYEGINGDNKEDFEATCEADNKDENGNMGIEAAAEIVMVPPAVSQSMDIPPCMHNLDLDAMHALEFSKYANIGVVDPEDGELRIGMEYSSRKSVVAAIRSYIISRGKKGSWEIRRYNGRHTCAIGTISQDHFELDSDTVVEAIRPLVEPTCPSRHINSNFLRAFKVTHLQKLVVNIGDSRTMEEYNINYKSAKTHERKHVGFTYSIFAQQRIEANMQQVGNIVVHRFDRQNEVFEVRKMPTEKVLVVDLARQTCDVGTFRQNDYHIAMLLLAMLTSISIGSCMCMMCTR